MEIKFYQDFDGVEYFLIKSPIIKLDNTTNKAVIPTKAGIFLNSYLHPIAPRGFGGFLKIVRIKYALNYLK